MMIRPSDRFKQPVLTEQAKEDIKELETIVGNTDIVKDYVDALKDYLRRNADVCPKPKGVESQVRIHKPKSLLGIPPTSVFLHIDDDAGKVMIDRIRIEKN